MTEAEELNQLLDVEERPAFRAVLLTVRPWELVAILNSLRTREAFAVVGFCDLYDTGLELPETARVTGVNYDPFVDRFLVRMEDEAFPEVPEATEIPRYAVSLKAKLMPSEDAE